MSQFDLVVERKNSFSVKWDMMEQVYTIPDASNILPMWVADMDFKAPPPVIDAMQARLEDGVFGYSFVSESCKAAIVNWHQTEHNWTIDPKKMIFHHGVVPAIAAIVETFTSVGDPVAIMSPVYPPFFAVPEKLERDVLYAPMDEKNGIYSLNIANLEQTFKDGAKLFILCNPHNPAGVVWKKDDLQQIIALAIKYDVVILSDEIHGDLVLPGAKHIPLLSLEGAEAAKIISTIAPTKTFNLAGVQAAMMIASNNELFKQLQLHAEKYGYASINVFAAAAVEAAYTNCRDWLVELKQYVLTNMQYVQQQLNALPGIHVHIPEGTYLMWIDYRELKIDEKEMMRLLLEVGQVALEPGTKYGENGRGFLRINIGCSFKTVQDGIERFKRAYDAVYADR